LNNELKNVIIIILSLKITDKMF